jgi:acetylornithine/succinyldiaminopimelate/putrescine aminotransferase
MLTDRQLFFLHLGQTSAEPLMLEITRAEGVFMYGPSGEKYLDLISGVSVSNTGHRHPRVIAAVREQADSYLHLMVYGAMKLAKRFTRRSRIIYFRNAYHGSTHGALSVQGSEKYRSAFRPLLPGTLQIDFNDFSALDAINKSVACVIIEPVQGEAGVIFPAEGYLEEIRQRCSANGALLIFDEVQTGFGRTGSMFAIQRFNVVPDILVLAKALGGGMPLGAFISSKEIMAALIAEPQLGHITTFGGHPVCCAAGLASLNVILEEKLVDNCNAKSAIFKRELNHQLIKEIRGEGLLLAVRLADPEYVRYVIKNAPRYGIILDYFLFCDDAFRIAPPLTISNDEINTACRQLKLLLDEAMKNRGKG